MKSAGTSASRRSRWISSWHDRAVFHFLTSESDRTAYIGQVRRAVRRGGHLVVAARYSADALSGVLGETFHLKESRREEHMTPPGTIQSFVYCAYLID